MVYWEAVLVFLFGSWINFNLSTNHYKQITKPCEYKLKMLNDSNTEMQNFVVNFKILQ